ncbi:MAG: DNA polymerase I, partial [Candidatus Omnitrophota bacterium]
LEKYDTFAIWLDKDNTNVSICANDECIYQAKDPYLLSDPRIKKIGCDLKETKFFLADKKINLAGIYFDIMVAEYLINSSGRDFSLSTLIWNNLGVIKDESKLQSFQKANLIFKLKPILEKKLNEMHLSDLFFKLEMPLVSVLADMELNGIKVDVRFLNNLNKKIEERLRDLIKQIYQESKEEFNINSPKQLSVILFEKLKLPVIKKTKTGFSTDEEVLVTLAKTHDLPKLILEYRQLAKLKSTYIDGLLPLVDKDNKLHTTFLQTGTETGRLSSSNPNLQNIPIKTDLGREIRRAFIASKDYILSSDYSQIELRILAHLSEDKNLIKAFKDNQDVHKTTAASIFGIDEISVTDKMRETAKRINFGIIYGMSQFGLAKDLDITYEEAQSFIDTYFLRYPKVKDYIEKQIKLARTQGFVTTILNRRRYLPGILSKNNSIRMLSERQAVNTSIQGSAADLIKLAMLNVDQELKNKNLHSRMILQVHDELVFDVVKNELDEIKKIVREKMENVIKLEVPVKVKISIGENWLELKEVV